MLGPQHPEASGSSAHQGTLNGRSKGRDGEREIGISTGQQVHPLPEVDLPHERSRRIDAAYQLRPTIEAFNLADGVIDNRTRRRVIVSQVLWSPERRLCAPFCSNIRYLFVVRRHDDPVEATAC